MAEPTRDARHPVPASTRLASLSVDLDDHWTYLKSRGRAGWESLPTFLELAVPRVLEFLGRHAVCATFFVVGCDAACPHHRPLLRRIVDAGCEIGNHSYHHDLRFDLFDAARVEDEIRRTEDAIVAVGACQPLGFRAPGHATSPLVLEVLSRRGYVYDASPWPTFVLPLVRRLYLKGARLTPAERAERRRRARGSWWVRASNRAYALGSRGLVVVPVTTVPFFRTPFHVTYLNALNAHSELLARRYFQFALALCRWTDTAPSILLHLTDFLGSDDPVDLSLLPGMALPYPRKLALLDHVLRALKQHFRVVTLLDHARSRAAAIDPRASADGSGAGATGRANGQPT